MRLIIDRTITGTIDAMRPALEALGYRAVGTLARPIPLTEFDPYGCGRVDSVNVRKPSDVWHGLYVWNPDTNHAWLTDATYGTPNQAQAPFCHGLFPLVTVSDLES